MVLAPGPFDAAGYIPDQGRHSEPAESAKNFGSHSTGCPIRKALEGVTGIAFEAGLPIMGGMYWL